jgi:hypothetical protein
MLFRYKIDKCNDHICDGVNLIHYNVKIQRYNENNIWFKWTTCTDTTLKCIVELLSQEYCFSPFENALQEIAETIAKYGNVDKTINEYICKIVIRDMKSKNNMNSVEQALDKTVLTNGWNTIEIKENE